MCLLIFLHFFNHILLFVLKFIWFSCNSKCPFPNVFYVGLSFVAFWAHHFDLGLGQNWAWTQLFNWPTFLPILNWIEPWPRSTWFTINLNWIELGYWLSYPSCSMLNQPWICSSLLLWSTIIKETFVACLSFSLVYLQISI